MVFYTGTLPTTYSGTRTITNSMIRIANAISVVNCTNISMGQSNDSNKIMSNHVDKEKKNRLSQMGRSPYGPQKLTRKK
jgi:hypothetical protein